MRPTTSTLLSAALFATISAGALAPSEAAPSKEVSHPPKLKVVGPAPSSQPVQFDVILPLRDAADLDALLAQQQDPTSPGYHHWLQPADFAARFGADPTTVKAVASALQQFGLQVTTQSRSLHVAGTATQVSAAFGVNLAMAADVSGHKRVVATNPLNLPAVLAAAGAYVTAFSASGYEADPACHNSTSGYFHSSTGGYFHSSTGGYGQLVEWFGPSGYFYDDLKQAYGYPSYQTTTGKGHGQRLDGTGATVAVVMASDVLDSDVSDLFEALNFRSNSGQPSDPAISARRPVNGGATFSPASDSTEEATVDVEQVLGGAPGSRVILYDTPDLSDQSLISAYTAIVNDNQADVVSSSFGQCELYYTAAYNGGVDQTNLLGIYSELFKQGNAQGITFIAASGDAGGLGCLDPDYFSGSSGRFVAGVSVPAADPNVTAVGGTNLVTAAASGGVGSAYRRENAWADPEVAFDPFGLGVSATGGVWGAGGGVSTIYAKPSYQSLVSTGSSTFRTVPDVGMQAGGCPDVAELPCNGGDSAFDGLGDSERSSLNVVFDGQWANVVGTSLAAPEMASAVALLVETQGRQGNLNPYLYALAQRQAAGGATYFHQTVEGFNGIAKDGGTYNFATGVGTPDVAAMIGLASAVRAGNPQSASNP